MPKAKSLTFLKKDKTGYNVGETVHDFMTSKKVTIIEVIDNGNRRNYVVRFDDKSTQVRNRDDLDVA